MYTYIIKRLLLVIPTFIGISMLVFFITRFVPGGPIERMLAAQAMKSGDGGGGGGRREFGGGVLDKDQLAELEAYYGFDKPVWQSYVEWLTKVLRLDLGYSTRYGEPVWESIKQRLPISIYYGLATLFLSYFICIPLGIIKALKHGKWIDNVSSIFIFIGYALPTYAVALILLVFFCSRLELFPLGGFVSDNFSELSFLQKVGDLLYHSAMPLVAYMIGSFAVMSMLMKNSLIENLSSDYVRTAMAKGVSFKNAILKHALQNSLIPLATHMGSNISVLIAGSFFIEKIFNIDGFGLLGFESVVERDYPVVMGILVISAFLQLIGNIFSDICVALVDPRVQFD